MTPTPLHPPGQPPAGTSQNLRRAAGAAHGRVDDRTWVELVFDRGRIERWIRFGAIVEERIVTRQNRFVAFQPGSVFAFVRWAAGERGTVASRLDILIAPRPGEARTSVPGVTPGGTSLLRLNGWPRVKAALEAIDAVEAIGIAPEAVAPDHWRHLHNRLLVGERAQAYSASRHAAWLLRRAVS
ncbi:hypothetical protein KOAAANKH_00742 [Brevundimonas sp. NIBR10]|uniref:DUF2840 domain-containing protein n=1 Tax=Brevundimonas sp. NIBR10 TaxID=3015997 RepID=UPI0022F18659|nr:DUF2840 domain-containing protein [Brevundimonas sp. NIBR10]WGM45877.1 hypothetical protein KOAAANKH_00742 [Brevundimonas sp. NIBR10]